MSQGDEDGKEKFSKEEIENIEKLTRVVEIDTKYFDKYESQIPEILEHIGEMVENNEVDLTSEEFFKGTGIEDLVSDYYDEVYSNIRECCAEDDKEIREYAVARCNYMISILSGGG